MTKISIIVPAYNVEKYLVRCVESVLRQTFSMWELILIDDGSTDRTKDICMEYAKSEPRIKYLYQENQGQGIARNNGVEKSQGKYIFFLDADDWIREDTLECLYNYAKTEDLDIISFDRINVEKDINGEIVYRYCKLPIQIKNITDCEETLGVLYKLEGAVWDKFYKKELLIGVKQKGHPYEDSAILPSILVKANRIGQIREAFYFYWCVREDSTVNKSDTVFYMKDSIKECYELLTKNDKWDIYEEALRRYSEWMLLVARNHIARQKPTDDKKLVYDKFIQECWDLICALYPNEKQMSSYQYLVWGSYNLRSMVNRTQRNLRVPKYYYGFSNITSLMQQRSGNEIIRGTHNNAYREQMIQMDVEQSFKYLSEEEFKEIDFVCIDLLEERFLPVNNNGEIVTGSDALAEVTGGFETDIWYLGSEEWKKNAYKFIEFLREKFDEKQIILVENYLCMGYGRYGMEETFKDEYGDIEDINRKLKKCYEYFTEKCDGIHIVRNERKELEFTDIEYPHGCVPWHQNEYLYYEMADKIEQIVLEYTENR